jgi:hypothetical protein
MIQVRMLTENVWIESFGIVNDSKMFRSYLSITNEPNHSVRSNVHVIVKSETTIC